MITEENQKYKYYMHNINGKWKSKTFLHWAKFYCGGLDLHHILDRRIDYLIYPLNHKTHLYVVEDWKNTYFPEFLPKSCDILAHYCLKYLDMSIAIYFDLWRDPTPENLELWFKEIKELEKVITRKRI